MAHGARHLLNTSHFIIDYKSFILLQPVLSSTQCFISRPTQKNCLNVSPLTYWQDTRMCQNVLSFENFVVKHYFLSVKSHWVHTSNCVCWCGGGMMQNPHKCPMHLQIHTILTTFLLHVLYIQVYELGYHYHLEHEALCHLAFHVSMTPLIDYKFVQNTNVFYVACKSPSNIFIRK